MDIRRLPVEEAAVRRYVEEVWLPYHRDLAAAVESHELAEDIENVDEDVEWWLDHLEPESIRAWVAVAGADDESADTVADTEGELVGFITADVDESPSIFERPDWLIIGDFYVQEAYRGTGLARDLVDRAAEYAREAGCGALELNVDVDNERAVAFYEKVGFEPRRYRMHVDVEEV